MPARIVLPDVVIAQLVNGYRRGITIDELRRPHSLSRNKIISTLKEGLGDEYAACSKAIITMSGKKAAKKNRGKKLGPASDERKKKIGDANRGRKHTAAAKKKISVAARRFNSTEEGKRCRQDATKKAVETKRKNGAFERHSVRHSKWMKENAPMRGKKLSDASKEKMSEAKHRFYTNGGIPGFTAKKHTKESLEKMRESTSHMWATGKFDYQRGRKGAWRSKLEKNVFAEVKKLHPDARHSMRLTTDDRTYIFDIHVPSLNLLIEVNGDYWHLNPRLYEATHRDLSRGVTAAEIWERDAKKLAAATAVGFRTATLWEDEVRQTKNLHLIIEDITRTSLSLSASRLAAVDKRPHRM